MIITLPAALIHLNNVFLHFQPLGGASILSANLSSKVQTPVQKNLPRLPRPR
jgi:hypothetical protein